MKYAAVLVDDDATVQPAVREAAQALGLICHPFCECERALRFLAEERPPALLLVDLGVSNALALCHEVRRTPRLVHVPLVVTARRPGAADKAFAESVGAVLLPKPLTAAGLVDVVGRLQDRARAAHRWRRRPRLLIADDDAGILDTLAGIARDEGWDPLCAEDGVHALDLCGTSAPLPQLALIDWMMPGLDGVNVARRLRDNVGPLPIVLMSAHDEVKAHVAKVGAVGHLKKPFPLQDLVGIMQRAATAAG